MKLFFKSISLAISSSILLSIVLVANHAYSQSNIQIDNAWLRHAPPNAPVLGVYMQIKNTSQQPITLKSAEIAIAKRVEIHTVTMKDGMMSMFPIEQLILPAGKTTMLKPGSYHIMIYDFDKVPTIGEKINGTLNFTNHPKVKFIATVKKAKRPMKKMKGMKH